MTYLRGGMIIPKRRSWSTLAPLLDPEKSPLVAAVFLHERSRWVLLEKDLEVKKFMSFPCHFEGLRWKLEAIQIPKSHLHWIASRWIFDLILNTRHCQSQELTHPLMVAAPPEIGVPFKKSLENGSRRLTEFQSHFNVFDHMNFPVSLMNKSF